MMLGKYKQHDPGQVLSNSWRHWYGAADSDFGGYRLILSEDTLPIKIAKT
jgi:hypothetical protein